jgi:hypothetical protein
MVTSNTKSSNTIQQQRPIEISETFRLTSSVLVWPPHPTAQQILEFFQTNPPHGWYLSWYLPWFTHIAPSAFAAFAALGRCWAFLPRCSGSFWNGGWTSVGAWDESPKGHFLSHFANQNIVFVVFGGIDIYNIVFLCQSKNIMFVFWDVIKN